MCPTTSTSAGGRRSGTPPRRPPRPRSWWARPAMSRNARPSSLGGTTPCPTSLETRITGTGAARAAARSPPHLLQHRLLRHPARPARSQQQVGHQQGKAVHQDRARLRPHAPHRPAGIPRGLQGDPSGWPVLPVPADALAHLRVPRLGRGNEGHRPARPGRLGGPGLGVAALAAAGAAEHEQDPPHRPTPRAGGGSPGTPRRSPPGLRPAGSRRASRPAGPGRPARR